MADTTRKLKLMALLEDAQAAEIAFWDGLSNAERSARGTPDRWAAKDVMAHITVWKDRLTTRLEADDRDEVSERDVDFNEVNRQIFEANRERPWDDLLEYEAKVFSRLVAAVDALTDEAIEDAERFEWTEGRPLWWRIGFDVYYHPLDHLSILHRDRGDRDLAQRSHERIAHGMRSLDDSDLWQGTITYNLACFYALDDQPRLALEKLSQALKLNPGLVDWSKEDSDLDSLHELPDFQALYED
jgi:tetratricopeptide (TPR) repeat protein